MENTGPDHEKVHFRRSEIASLKRFPSATCPSSRPLPKQWRARVLGWAAIVVLVLPVLLLAFSGTLYLIGVDAIGNERLRMAAERAITRLAGFDADVRLGELRLGLGEASLLALEVRNARIARADNGVVLASAGTLRFGLKALPLLDGRIEVAQVGLTDAAISPAGLPMLQNGGLKAPVMKPDEVYAAVFDTVKRAFTTTESSGLNRISLTNVGLRTAQGQDVPDFQIETLQLRRVGEAEIVLEGSAVHRGRGITLSGKAERDRQSGAITALSLDVVAPDTDSASADGSEGAVVALGHAQLSLSGSEAGGEEEGWLALDMRLEELVAKVDKDTLSLDEASMRAAFAEGDEAFSVVASRIGAGRTQVNFQGAVVPITTTDGEPAYGYDLVSRNSVLAPADSPEPALPVAMRLAGRYEPAASRLNAEKIEVRTSDGELAGSAVLTMPAGMSPGIRLAIYVADMPTAHAKQFWPWFAAGGARNWTLEHVFGGRVRDSNMRLNVPPGRLGNGVPLSQEEVVGRFALANTRFDIAGDIPPVRDGTGWVEFRGTDVAVGLSQGKIYMPSGRMVEVSHGSLMIDAAHQKPRIGKLEIDVEGEAAAMVELASYEPIDASRFHDITPGDLDGGASGHISADIPLQAGIPVKNLDWRVALDYEDLSIAKPFEGQEVTNANGSLLVQPDRAEFSAEAELNAVPARLRVVEPLGGSEVERVRHVELQMDNAARDRLFPGLDVLVSGPFEIVYDEQPDGRKKVAVALDTARLTVPWIGWQKGAGIPATASFFLKEDGEVSELSEFALDGESFAVSGQIRLAGGGLQEARLNKVRLNRIDNYAATIRRTGSGYSVSVNGGSFDARGVIERALGNKGTGNDGAGSEGGVTVKASLATVQGFNGESLEQVEMTYSAEGAQPERLSVRAAAAAHGAVQLTKGVEQGRSTVRATSSNAGALLRFLNIYPHVEGGQLSLALTGASDDDLSGQFEIRDFWVVNEERLGSLVAASTENSNGEVDASRVQFERGSAVLSKGREQLKIRNGVLRGPLIGSTFQGTLYDPNDNTAITGTFLPLYGINRVFGEIPIIGQILGNGRNGGLIGITYRLTGKLEAPTLEINPISAIAPGIFRRIFEFH
ncbi:DUF3971 domain-containing protein [Chelativorans salis]|uniref:DUF3971 domain-containing protein n=1 Tax=Chelativorans salis TaxID=2978478 RepID=A0ABT2LLF4_9HYPH|nr:DUF3971 domain-containing protein [Chelativorans sp. EGI FJ00035]MCT7375353.1 DUF3971 domain-containing protein [Chelativorans sp. EGI FJ00035]